jgi:hypothetical protein
MKIIQKTCAAALVILGLSSSVWAADLTVTINSADQTVTITNQLDADINLIALTNGTDTFSTGDSIPAYKSVTIRTSREVPVGLNAARCRAAADSGIPGIQADENGVYTLSVSSSK